ncbi:MAG: kelch repeat-containing protein [Dokdonella sp.]
MNPVARWSLKTLFGWALVAVAMAVGAPVGAVTNTWGPAAALATARDSQTSTLLSSGKVLVTGGLSNSGLLASAELYDPASNIWTPAASLPTARYYHTATLLPSGRVLVAGGVDTNGNLSSATLYDPASNIWIPAGSLTTARNSHTATVLPSGQVLVVGGYNGVILAIAERYDPASNTWSPAGSLATARYLHSATLLPSGKVLVAGGVDNNGNLSSAELYDPGSNTWTPAGSLATARSTHTATLLPSGQVLVVAGQANVGVLASAELFDPELAPDTTRTPNLNAVNTYLLPASKLAASAGGSTTLFGATITTGFWPLLEGSAGASNNSTSNAPVFQVQRIDNDKMRFIPNDETGSFTDTTFTGSAAAFAGFPAGPVRVRAWVNGVPSAERYSTLAVKPGAVATPTAIGGINQATVNFAAVAYAGGAPVTTYAAIALPGGTQATCVAPRTSIAINPLAAGTYTFVIVALNAAGQGAPSAQSNSVFVSPADEIFRYDFEMMP